VVPSLRVRSAGTVGCCEHQIWQREKGGKAYEAVRGVHQDEVAGANPTFGRVLDQVLEVGRDDDRLASGSEVDMPHQLSRRLDDDVEVKEQLPEDGRHDLHRRSVILDLGGKHGRVGSV
jgi:hypothetical protein